MAEIAVHHPDGMVGYRELGRDKPVRVGSGEQVEIRIESPTVRPHVCTIRWRDGGFWVDAAPGAQQLAVNGQRVQSARLHAGDEVSVGRHRLVVDGEPAEFGEAAESRTAGPAVPADAYYTPMWKSRVFVGTAAGLAAIGLTVLILWVAVYRRAAEKQFDAALADLDSGLFDRAIRRFDQFLEAYPEGELAEKAVVWRGVARVRQFTDGSQTLWPSALEAIAALLDESKDREFFAQRTDDVIDLLMRTSAGLAEDARDRIDPDSLAKAGQALTLLERSFPRSKHPAERIEQTRSLMAVAQAAIDKEQRRRETLQQMKRALAERRPMEVYALHRELYRVYPDLRADKDAQTLREEARQAERDAVVLRPAIGKPPSARAVPAIPTRTVVRHRGDPKLAATGRVLPVVAADALFAIDVGHGKVLWRTAIGYEPSFPPMLATGNPDWILVHRTADESLALLESATGKELWRRSLGARILRWGSVPLINRGFVYAIADDLLEDVPIGFERPSPLGLDRPSADPGQTSAHGKEGALEGTAGSAAPAGRQGVLLVFRLASGEPVGEYVFPQPLAGSPAFDPARGRVIVLGERLSLYTLLPAEQRCEQVVALDHESQTIHGAPVVAGRFLFLVEDQGQDRCRLRCLVFGERDDSLRQTAVIEDLPGRAWNAPDVGRPPAKDAAQVKGGRLFIVTDQDHFSAYGLGGEEDKEPLTLATRSQPTYEAPTVPVLPLATSERELWTAGTELRRYTIDVQVRRAKPDVQIPLEGQACLAPRRDGDTLTLAVQDPSGLVRVLGFDANTVTERWRTELGVLPDAVLVDPGSPQSLSVVTSAGTAVLSEKDLGSDQIVAEPIPTGTRRGPVVVWQTLSEWKDGVVKWGGIGQTKLSHQPAGGQPKEHVLPAPANSLPVVFGQGLLVPSSDGRLYWIDPRTGSELAEPFTAPYVGGRATPVGPVAIVDDKGVVLGVGRSVFRLELAKEQQLTFFRALARIELQAGSVGQFAPLKDRIFLTQGDQLELRSLQDLERLDGWALGAPVSRPPVSIGQDTLLVTDAQQIVCVGGPAGSVDKLWELPLDREPLGLPVPAGNGFWLAFPDGILVEYGIADGACTKVREVAVGRAIAGGPWIVGKRLAVLMPDGSLAGIDLAAPTTGESP